MTTLRFDIEGMTCGGCAARAERAMAAVAGVASAHVNFADHTATVEADAALAGGIAAAATQAGYPAQLRQSAEPSLPSDGESHALVRHVILAAVLTLPVFMAEMGGHIFPVVHHWIASTVGLQTSWIAQFVLVTLVLIGPGRVFFRLGVPALIRRAPDMNSLVVLGAGAAWAYSTVATFAPAVLPDGAVVVYFEAAAVIVTLILLGRLLEARAKGRTGAAIRRLIGLRPDTAQVEREGQIQSIPLVEVRVGDTIHLAAGARVPVDGQVVHGVSSVDEAMISGEPIPVEKAAGDPLVAGTINGNGALVMRAEAVGSATMLARIIAMVAEAQGARLPVQDLVNRITLWFVPAVMVIAAATVLAWLIFGTLPMALVAGVSVLIIACPCAMGLATPTSIMVGTGRGAELGVLFRRGDALQTLQDVDVVAFDKTGTLTAGTPRVVWHDLSEEQFARVAAIEAKSSHPLANAIVEASAGPLPEASEVKTIPGKGVRGTVAGSAYVIGNRAMMEEAGVEVSLPEEGGAATRVFVGTEGQLIGSLALEDEIKPEAKAAVAHLASNGAHVVMVSGDADGPAQRVARALGIAEVIANVRPDGKARAVETLKTRGKVAFVGDGINDAPALAAADVGIAMGSGTDVAVESADVVLVSGNPMGVARAMEVSRRTLRNIRQNLGWAFGYNVILIPVAAMGLLSPQLAALAMAASSVLVVSNALRLKFIKVEAL